MGKKKIQKAPKTPKAQEEDPVSDHEPDHSPEPEPAPKGKRGAKTASKPAAAKMNIFSDSFNTKVDNFKSFYREFLALKGGDGDQDAEFEEVTRRVAH